MSMDLNGKWFNELNSYMILEVNGNHIKGLYHTKVGDAEGDYELRGIIDTDDPNNFVIGWTVVWHNDILNSDAVTSWSGQVQAIKKGERIFTTWLLSAKSKLKDTWGSTKIGQDVFTRKPQTPEEMEEHLARGKQHSHPS
jgi:hypothetical protein